MGDQHLSQGDQNEYGHYEIRVRGHLDGPGAARFAGLTIMPQTNGDTLLCGYVVDQAALHGWLKKVRDLGLPLLSVNRAEPGPSSGQDAAP